MKNKEIHLIKGHENIGRLKINPNNKPDEIRIMTHNIIDNIIIPCNMVFNFLVFIFEILEKIMVQ